ncbi:MAG TPA: threonine/serine dehydratase [Candidatus Limnocylindrales bacterium]|nr:threonine/serine dehydratase [Candidatus Limnocylindrales bacterium]
MIPLADIRAARKRISGAIFRTPLVKLNVNDAPADIYLKLECLQPIGSFKIRGASNAMALASRESLAQGVWTASAGNMAQGVAWNARRLGIPCTVVVPEGAPATKLAAVERMGGTVVAVPHDEWFDTFRTHKREGIGGLFVHAFSDDAVMAGNGTIGLEILEDLPDVDAVVVPYGGGGLISGIASAIRALRPETKIFAAEASTSAPLRASLAKGEATDITHTRTFVDGIGGPRVFPEMFDLAKELIEGALISTLEEIAAAIRLMVERNRVVAEGAAGASVAAALAGKAGRGKVVAIVSGGNIDTAALVTILQGGVPS